MSVERFGRCRAVLQSITLTHFFFSLFIFLLSSPRRARATVRDLPGACTWPVGVGLPGRRGQPKIKAQTHGLPEAQLSPWIPTCLLKYSELVKNPCSLSLTTSKFSCSWWANVASLRTTPSREALPTPTVALRFTSERTPSDADDGPPT